MFDIVECCFLYGATPAAVALVRVSVKEQMLLPVFHPRFGVKARRAIILNECCMLKLKNAIARLAVCV